MSSYFVAQQLSADSFMPHGMCYLWQPNVLALHIISDALIALAYWSIPITLVYFVKKRTDTRFNRMFVCFAVFIAACSATHLMDIWTIWHPAYWLSGGIKAITALVSVLTSILLIKFLPAALKLPSSSALHSANLALKLEVGARVRAEEALQRDNETLERRIADRTRQLEALNRTLAADNARFAIAADAAGLGFWNLDVATNRLQWDAQMFRLYGYEPREGEQPCSIWADRLHPEDRERCIEESAAALRGECASDTEFRVIHPDGTVRHLRGASQISLGADGKALRMFGVNFDITNLKHAVEQFRLAIEAAPTGMLVMSASGSIVLVNAQIESLFGYTREELLGQQIEMLVPKRFRARHPEFRQEFFAAPKARPMGEGRDLYGLRKDGSEVPIEIGLNPLHTSEGDFVLSSIIDLTLRREFDQMRSDFVSTVSHELRTPLTSISGSLGLLRSGALGPLPHKAASMVNIAYENSGRLVRIINDILDIGKLEAGELALQMISVPLTEVLRQSIEANSGYAAKYAVKFVLDDCSDNEQVIADPDRLMQVMTNLLSNAAKFSPADANVYIRARARATTLRVEVEDSGSGIPEAFKDRIFERFAQADGSATRRFEGTGLGLSIARKLMEAMGGQIGFNTVVGRGTVFYLELPRSGAVSTVPTIDTPFQIPADEPLPKAVASPRLLYVIDDVQLIDIIRRSLAGNTEFVLAQGWQDAERLIREEQFELVVVDDATAGILVERNPRLGRSLPIVILTADPVSPEIYSLASAVISKSQMPAEQVAATILSCLPLNYS